MTTWKEALERYPEALKLLCASKKKKDSSEKLERLDQWYQQESKEWNRETCLKIVEWKLSVSWIDVAGYF